MFRNPVQQAIMLLSGAILTAAVVTGGLLHQETKPPPDTSSTTIRLACQDHVNSAVCIIALEKGIFLAAGIPVTTLRFNNGPDSAEALFSGSADIAAMGDTTAITALSRQLPLTIIASHDRGKQVILASDQLLQQHPERVRGLLGALQRAATFIHENPDETAAILGRVTGLPIEQVEKSMKLHEYRLALDESVLGSLEETAEFLRAQGIIDRRPDLRTTTNAGYLP